MSSFSKTGQHCACPYHEFCSYYANPASRKGKLYFQVNGTVYRFDVCRQEYTHGIQRRKCSVKCIRRWLRLLSGQRPSALPVNCEGVVRPLVEPQHAAAGFFTVKVSRAITVKWGKRQNRFPCFQQTQVLSENGCFGKYRHSVTRSDLNSVCLCRLVEAVKTARGGRFLLTTQFAIIEPGNGGTQFRAS